MSIIIPTTLSKEQIRSFQELYFEVYNEKINEDDAFERGLHLVQFIATIFSLEATGADEITEETGPIL